ncbi:hypothetical protein [Pleomorphovibrio marinus]|uniref:hypothetical protein n=1 Tax=Pleomorphovibrio marinus TaxID=2164132 RepID=UPI000E0BA558|nr:hypothetical protein [Pleomorphovibrio marinus]
MVILLLNLLFFSPQLQVGCFCETHRIPVSVWYDHENPEAGSSEIIVFAQQPFNKKQETILVVGDPFSAYFGNSCLPMDKFMGFNVLYVQDRGRQPSFINIVTQDNEINWDRALTIFSSFQYANDIELIRRKLLGGRKVFLFAQSSSAYLVHQYISLFPQNTARFVTLEPTLNDLQTAMGIYRHTKIENPYLNELDAHLKIDFYHYSTSTVIRKNSQSELLASIEKVKNSKGFYGSEIDHSTDVALCVRAFEHIYPYLQDSVLPTSEFSFLNTWKLNLSLPIIKRLPAIDFSLHGINYDQLRYFRGKGLLIAGKNSLITDHRVVEILAEHFQDCTLLLLNDSHFLTTLKEEESFIPFVSAFFNEDVDTMIEIYERLKKRGLVYKKANYSP